MKFFSRTPPRACHRPHLAVEQIVAARVAVYAGKEDQHYAYRTPEAYIMRLKAAWIIVKPVVKNHRKELDNDNPTGNSLGDC